MPIQPFYYCEACRTDHPEPPTDFHAAQADYELIKRIHSEEAEYDELESFFINVLGVSEGRFDEMTPDADDPSEWLWGDLRDELTA